MDIPKVVKSETMYDPKFFKVVQDTLQYSNGNEQPRLKIEIRDGAQVIPFFKDGTVYMLRQYRHGAGVIMSHFVSGYIEKGETPEDAAYRELGEEVGHTGKLTPLGSFNPYGGLITAKNHFFAATELERIESHHHDDFEKREIEVVRVPAKKVLEDILSGVHNEPISGYAFLLAWNKLGKQLF